MITVPKLHDTGFHTVTSFNHWVIKNSLHLLFRLARSTRTIATAMMPPRSMELRTVHVAVRGIPLNYYESMLHGRQSHCTAMKLMMRFMAIRTPRAIRIPVLLWPL